MIPTLFALLLLIQIPICCIAQWPRWEERTLDCTSQHHNKTGNCVLLAPNTKGIQRDPALYSCRREPIPQAERNTKLAANVTTRLACPIACEPEADLSVLQKKPVNNKNCQKYYTYGKYRDNAEGEWYLWMAEPCVTNLTTFCRYNDIPFHSNGATKQQ